MIADTYIICVCVCVITSTMSFHHIFRSSQHPVLREWKRQLPMIRPCYALSQTSTKPILDLMREHRIPMLCGTSNQVSAVNDYTLTIENTRVGQNEYIARKLRDMINHNQRYKLPVSSVSSVSSSSSLVWVYTKISQDGIENTRKMFEHIWTHKYILKGLVFDIHQFSHSIRGSIPPSKYSYKIALDYVTRNIVRPFESEYSIPTPCIMMDGRHHITRIEHLEELKMYIEPVISSLNRTELQLIVGDLFDLYQK